MNYIRLFSERFYSDWLPSFCDARDDSYSTDGFLDATLDRVGEHDAKWFLRAIDAGYVVEESGFFLSEASAAKEQIFWNGSAGDQPRKLFLWLEPIITIGAVARLIDEYGWPTSQAGLQSKAPWPFDLVGYGTDGDAELLAGEVKKSDVEIGTLIREMKAFCQTPVLEQEPTKRDAKNAYKKVIGIRRSWPVFFWALGPAGKGEVFKIERGDGDIFSMSPVAQDNLRYSAVSNRWRQRPH